jgi:general stress protein 26
MSLLHHPEDSAPEAVERVLEILRDFDTATLVTHTPEGRLHGRPMAIGAVDADGTLWFITDQTSQKAAEIRSDARALVTLQNSRRFVTANGDLTLVKNQQKVRELWKETDKLWFDNENDPDIVLLRFAPIDAEYWDTSGVRGVKFVFKAAKAFLTGEKAKQENDAELHGKVGR